MSIFGRVRARLSGSEAGCQADRDPHDWPLPSSYSTSKAGGRETVIPNPTIFRNAFVPSEATLGRTETSLVYPDISHAAVHLALLECFRRLRLSASRLDVELEKPAYSEKPRPREHYAPTRLPESLLNLNVTVSRYPQYKTTSDSTALSRKHEVGGYHYQHDRRRQLRRPLRSWRRRSKQKLDGFLA